MLLSLKALGVTPVPVEYLTPTLKDFPLLSSSVKPKPHALVAFGWTLNHAKPTAKDYQDFVAACSELITLRYVELGCLGDGLMCLPLALTRCMLTFYPYSRYSHDYLNTHFGCKNFYPEGGIAPTTLPTW